MKVIAVAGRTGARTSDIVKLLRLYPGVRVASFGDFLRKQNRDHADLQEFGQAFLSERGAAAMVEGTLEGKRPSRGQALIVDGLRHDEVWSALKGEFPQSKLFCVDPPAEVLVASLIKDKDMNVLEARKRVEHPVEQGVSGLAGKADCVTRGGDPAESEENAMRGLFAMIDPAIIPEPIQEKFARTVLHQKLGRDSRRQLLMSRALAKGRQAIFSLLMDEGGCEEAPQIARRLEVSEDEIHSRLNKGLLFAVRRTEDETEFPLWQFTDGGVLPGLRQVIAALSNHNDFAKLRFFLSGNHFLGGDTPLAALRQGRVDETVKAAEQYLVHGAA